MKKLHSQFLAFIFTLGILGHFGIEKTFANACVIQGGPIPEMTAYAQKINTELTQLVANSPKNECSIKQSAYDVFEAARADISAMKHTVTDFRYNINSVTNGGKNAFVKRDEKFFDTIEKRISDTVDQMANSCQLDADNRKQLHDMIIETQTFRHIYRSTAIGSPVTTAEGIRQENSQLIEKISQAYNPNATVACVPNSSTQKGFLEKLKSSINLGASLDASLSTWREALDLARGGWKSLSTGDAIARQRSLLLAELSRQWLSQNAKNVLLRNFDCYKSRTTGVNGIENKLEARAACLQLPITGLEKVYNIGANAKTIYSNIGETWNSFAWSANNTEDLVIRRDVAISRQMRSINIEEMYAQLNLLASTDSDNNTNTQKWLIDLHINLMATNNLLEQRLPAMQNNCMKWQPNITGGCR